MSHMLIVRFPDGNWEYHIPYRNLTPGEVVTAAGGRWTVLSVDELDGKSLASVTPEPLPGSWPGPVEDVELYAPAV